MNPACNQISDNDCASASKLRQESVSPEVLEPRQPDIPRRRQRANNSDDEANIGLSVGPAVTSMSKRARIHCEVAQESLHTALPASSERGLDSKGLGEASIKEDVLKSAQVEAEVEAVDEDIAVLNIDGSATSSPVAIIRSSHEQATPALADAEKEHLREAARKLGPDAFIQTFVFEQGISVHSLLDVFDIGKPLFISSISELQLLSLLRYVLVQFCRRRPKIKHINTIQDVVSLLKSCKNIMILTGAGVSVSCGIPDFRSPNGIYTRLYSEFGLEDPQQMFDIEYFRETPELFYSFAKELYPSNFTPSPSHAFIKLVEERGKLLRNYTQNIDTLEHIQGIERVLNCHGSFATATCIGCGYHCKGSDIKGDIMAQRVPMCPRCHSAEDRTKGTGVRDNGNEGRSLTHLLLEGSGGIRSSGIDSSSDDEGSEYGLVEGVMKPDITFFGEKLPDAFDKALAEDRDKVDLLLVMGSSLKVAPVSEIMSHLPHDVPQIIINKTPILHLNFDVQLLGDADNIVAYLAHECGWELAHPRIPGGSTKSDEFVRNMKRPAADPPPVVEQIARRDGKGKTTVVMQEYEIPSHWHLFPQAIVTAKDLKVVCGEEYVRLESDASGYSSSSGSGNSSSDGDGRGKDGDNDDDEGSSDDESETGTPGDGNYK